MEKQINRDWLTHFLENPPFESSMAVEVLPYLFYVFGACAVLVRILYLRSREQKVGKDFFDFEKVNWGKLEGTIVAVFMVLAILSVVVLAGLHMAYHIPIVEVPPI